MPPASVIQSLEQIEKYILKYDFPLHRQLYILKYNFDSALSIGLQILVACRAWVRVRVGPSRTEASCGAARGAFRLLFGPFDGPSPGLSNAPAGRPYN